MATEQLTEGERCELADTWRRRAEQLELQAAGYRALGDQEYAVELETAALDNRIAAERIELGVSA